MKRGILGLVVVMALLVGTAAFAADWGTDTTAVYKRDRFNIRLGAFITSLDTTAQLNSTYYGKGTSVDFEKVLGLDTSNTVFRFDGSWRFLPRHQLVLSYMEIDRSGSKTLNQNVQWGNNIYLAGLKAQSNWNTTQTNLYYRYSFVQTDKGEFGGSIGVSYVQQTGRIQGWAQAAGTSYQYYANRQGSIDAPVPVIGLFGTYEFTPKFSMSGDIQYLQVNISGVDGKYTDARLTFDYFPWKTTGFGLGYLYDSLNVGSSKNSWDGDFDYKFDGFLAYVSFRF